MKFCTAGFLWLLQIMRSYTSFGIARRTCNISALPVSQSRYTQHVFNRTVAWDAVNVPSVWWYVLSGTMYLPLFCYLSACHHGQNGLHAYAFLFVVYRPWTAYVTDPHLGLQAKPDSSRDRVKVFRPISSASLPVQCYRHNARGAPKCDLLRTFSSIQSNNPPPIKKWTTLFMKLR